MAFLNTLSAREVPYFNPTCPQGGKWYACDSTTKSKFIGCCRSNPCDLGCSDGNLVSTSFNGSAHGTYPDASCGESVQFWSCNGTAPPFWGCCRSNPCATKTGCPASDLEPARMNDPNQFSQYATGTVDAMPSATGSAKPSSTGGSSSHTGAIVGGVIGGIVVIVLIIAVLVYVLRRRRLRGNEAKPIGVEQAPLDLPPVEQKYNYPGSPAVDGKPSLLLITPGSSNVPRLTRSIAAPPLYSSPNPNSFGYHEVSQSPQELPGELPRSAPSAAGYRFSELPVDGETARTELESPEPSPKPPQANFSKKGDGVGLGVV